jgi:hypothetical protein
MTVVWNGLAVLREVVEICTASEKDTALRIAENARKKCPKGEFERAAKSGQAFWKVRYPGMLRDSIKVAPSKYKNGGWIVYVPGQGSATYYVRWVELGAPARSKEQWQAGGHAYPVPRQPFMRPASEEEKKRFRKRLLGGLITKLR